MTIPRKKQPVEINLLNVISYIIRIGFDMKGVIINFCGGKTSKKGNHIIVEAGDAASKEDAARLIGKNVAWRTPSGKKISGKITKAHGNSGAVKAIMEKGLPGIALGKQVIIEG